MKTWLLLLTAMAFAGPKPGTTELKGKVLEVVEAGEYRYLRIADAAGERWAAVRADGVKAGDAVKVQGSVLMVDFESPRLRRKFDQVLFGVLVGPGGSTSVAKAVGPDARTVAEIYSGKTKLRDHAVALRGRVVKYNAKILGANWLHLRDGSGKEAAHDNDVVVVSVDTAAVGDVVTVRGTVTLDKDLGSGYRYPVLIENAKVIGREGANPK